jgi:hypothetical protein
MMCLLASYKRKMKSDPELDPDPLVRGTDPGILDPDPHQNVLDPQH